MKIVNDVKLDFSDVLIQPKRSSLASRKNVDLIREFKFMHSPIPYRGVPIVASNMDSVATFAMASALMEFDLSTALHKHYSKEELVEFFNNCVPMFPANPVFYSMGIKDDDVEKLDYVHSETTNVNAIMIDVANGYSNQFADFVSKIRYKYPDAIICAGNVVTYEMTEQLLISGADIVKIGIGPGSMCTTRMQTGVGYPQLSAIIECADAAHGLGGHICADGGCRIPADVAKAFGAGADFVMLGGMLAGHLEGGGKKIYGSSYRPLSTAPSMENPPTHEMKYASDMFFTNPEDNEFYFYNTNEEKWEHVEQTPTHMEFYGMSSKTAMDKHHGGVAEYRSSEGKTQLIPYKGKVEDTVRDILGGLRSTCTYTGSSTLKELSKRTTFVRVNKIHEPYK